MIDNMALNGWLWSFLMIDNMAYKREYFLMIYSVAYNGW